MATGNYIVANGSSCFFLSVLKVGFVATWKALRLLHEIYKPPTCREM